jgi:uncharacterized protein YbjT (DUF2867 family)
VSRSPDRSNQKRRALLAGASGLVGRALLALLLEAPQYGSVHAILRRPLRDLPKRDKLTTTNVDFDRLPALPAVDDVFIALGTTIKAAGSEQAFRQVDFDAVLATARAGRAAGATRLLVVSALGADPSSRVFYNRVKGEMELAIAGLGYERVVIAQPSLLLGDREALGQPPRPAERWAMRLMALAAQLLPAGIRPIRAEDVARSLLRAALDAAPGVTRLRSAQMQPASRAA